MEDPKSLANILQENVIDKNIITLEDIGMITAHANANKLSDVSEAKTIDIFFPKKPPVTGFKWCFGQYSSGIRNSRRHHDIKIT